VDTTKELEAHSILEEAVEVKPILLVITSKLQQLLTIPAEVGMVAVTRLVQVVPLQVHTALEVMLEAVSL
jgi:hypothetical protein